MQRNLRTSPRKFFLAQVQRRAAQAQSPHPPVEHPTSSAADAALGPTPPSVECCKPPVENAAHTPPRKCRAQLPRARRRVQKFPPENSGERPAAKSRAAKIQRPKSPAAGRASPAFEKPKPAQRRKSLACTPSAAGKPRTPTRQENFSASRPPSLPRGLVRSA